VKPDKDFHVALAASVKVDRHAEPEDEDAHHERDQRDGQQQCLAGLRPQS